MHVYLKISNAISDRHMRAEILKFLLHILHKNVLIYNLILYLRGNYHYYLDYITTKILDVQSWNGAKFYLGS